MGWRMQVFKQALLARVPFGPALRRIKRQYVGYEPDARNLIGTLSNLEQMIAATRALGRSFERATVLEIGSGWFPTIPIMLAVHGARRVVMTDLTPHMDVVTFGATLRFLKKAFPENERLAAIARLSDLPISYVAPFRPEAVPDRSIDFVISRTVLEHIPPTELLQLLADLRPKLAADGLMVHVVDNSDHLEHRDKTISRINFLTWSERKHALINWLMKGGESRLRHHEYPPLFERAGYRVVAATREVHGPTREIAESLPLAPPYRTMSADDLAVLTSIFVVAPVIAAPAEVDTGPVLDLADRPHVARL